MGGKPSNGRGTSLLVLLLWEDVSFVSGMLSYKALGMTKLVTKKPIRQFRFIRKNRNLYKTKLKLKLMRHSSIPKVN